MAELMLEGKLVDGDTAHVRLKDGKVIIEKEDAPAKEEQPADAAKA